jgi:CRISPR-associated protein Csd1
MCDRIQYLAAERRVGRTLSDAFYSSLSSRPMLALGGLMKITKARASQLKGGEAAMMIRLGEVLPSPEELSGKERFNLKDQALFALGFYHQRAEDMKKKETKNDEPAQ